MIEETARLAAPEERAAILNAAPFTNIEGLDVPVIGFRVPDGDGRRRILVSFTCDHFDSSEVQQLAAEAVADYLRAKNAPQSGQPTTKNGADSTAP